VATTSGGTTAARGAAVADLGSAVRSLARAVVETEADDVALARAAALAREAAGLLSSVVRPAHRLARVDERTIGGRIYSPVTGAGNPVAPPLRIVTVNAGEGWVEAECTLHRVHEGPPTYGHGGMSAMLMDQVLGTVAALSGQPGLTLSLETTYRRPVPLAEPLRVTGRLVTQTGNLIETAGEITALARPGVPLVTATATFVVPTPDQRARLFGHVVSDGDPVPAGD
jgi:acyl-coenzyme A thioesterase PaaI-like protein